MNLSLNRIVSDKALDRLLVDERAIRIWNYGYENLWNGTHHLPYHILRSVRRRKRGIGIKLNCRVVARSPKGAIFGIRETDMAVKAIAQLIQTNIFNTAQTITDTGNTNRSVAANSAATLPRILGGTGTTAAAFTDYKMQTWTDDANHRVAATINPLSGSSFTITGVITNNSGSDIAYAEVGVDVTVGGWLFLLGHDVGTAYIVSTGGTLTVSYAAAFS